MNRALFSFVFGILFVFAPVVSSSASEVGREGSKRRTVGHARGRDSSSNEGTARNRTKSKSRIPAAWRSRLPQTAVYPSQTAIKGVPWVGEKPPAIPKAVWSIHRSPGDLEVDPRTGQVRWNSPLVGLHLVQMRVATGEIEMPVQWYLRVVPNDFPDAKLYSTKHLDYVFPAKYVNQMAEAGLAPVIDKVWERMLDLFGYCPSRGKQVIKYGPDMGGGAHSGNPVMMGPGWFKEDPIENWNWMLHIPLHEFGHNFHGTTHIGPIISGQKTRSSTVFSITAWNLRKLR